MITAEEEKCLKDFQRAIEYEFNDISLLRQALTTPSRGHKSGESSYEILETLGDVVLKLVLSLKLYEEREKTPGLLTQKKQMIENDATLNYIAEKYFDLDKYVLKDDKQEIKNTNILADVFEALCAAIFLDSKKNLTVVERIIINPFYEDLDKITQNSLIFSKNELLEYLQATFKTTPDIRAKFKKVGQDHDPKWSARAPVIYGLNKEPLINLPKELKSGAFKSKKEAEKDLYKKIYDYIKKKEEE